MSDSNYYTGVKAPVSLPIMTIDGTRYFVDYKLGQIREVINPHAFIDIIDGWFTWETVSHAFILIEDILWTCPIDKDGSLEFNHGEPNMYEVNFNGIPQEEADLISEIRSVLKILKKA